MDYSTHIAALQQALQRTDISDTERADITEHLQRLIEAQEAELALERGTQWMADRGGQLVLEDQGYRMVVGMAPTELEHYRPSSPGHFTQVAIGGPDVPPISEDGPRHPHNLVIFQETKGGEDYHFDSYGDSQQGSFAYLTEILLSGRDTRLADAFAALQSTGRHPGFVQALRHGAVQLRYQFVQALPSGDVRVGSFKVDETSRLRWNGGAVELLM